MAQNDAETADHCQKLRRVNEEKMIEYCGSREDQMVSTAISTGIISEGQTLDVDFDALFALPTDTVPSFRQQRELALGLVWLENPITDKPLIDEHDGFYEAMHAAQRLVDERFSEDTETVEETDEEAEAVETDEEGTDADASEEEVVDPIDEETPEESEAGASESESIVEEQIVVDEGDSAHVAEVVEGEADEIAEHIEEIGEALREEEGDETEE